MQNALEFLEDQKIFKSKHLDTFSFQIQRSSKVVLLSRIVPMYLTVQFDSKPFTNAKEIEHIVSNTVLTAKLAASQLRILE